MDMKILKEREFPLLKRKRVACMFEFTGPTPSIVQFRDSLSSKLKVDKGLVAIRHVYQRFGKPTAKVIAHIYSDKEYKEKLEKTKKTEKKEVEAAKKAEEEKKKAAEEAKATAEKPKEEVKVAEEKPKEEVKVAEEKPKEETPKEEVKEDGKETKTEEQKSK
ncbi:hypothetical protein HOE91_02290 [archaeon]|jgi:ribosomal protein S24E|nr:hypothetical protein [archaeon]